MLSRPLEFSLLLAYKDYVGDIHNKMQDGLSWMQKYNLQPKLEGRCVLSICQILSLEIIFMFVIITGLVNYVGESFQTVFHYQKWKDLMFTDSFKWRLKRTRRIAVSFTLSNYIHILHSQLPFYLIQYFKRRS